MVAASVQVERAHYRRYPKRSSPSNFSRDLRHAPTRATRWAVTAVLLSGGKGDYSACVSLGSPAWVAKHGTKLSFEEVLGLSPGVNTARRPCSLMGTGSTGRAYIDLQREHWHIDIAYLSIAGTVSYPCSILDGFNRAVVRS